MSSENINRPISSENEEDDCCDHEDAESNIQQSTLKKAGIEWPCLAGSKC